MELHRPEAVRAGAFSRIPCLRCEIAHLSGSAFLYLVRDKIPPAGTAPAGGTIFSAHSAPDKQTEIMQSAPAAMLQRQHKHKPKYRAYQRNDECHFHALCDTEHTDDQRINRRTDRGTKVLANLNHRIALHSARGRNLELRRNCKGNTDRAGRS